MKHNIFISLDDETLFDHFIQKLEETNFPCEDKSIYIVDKPLANANAPSYDYKKSLILLIPGYKIMIINFDASDSENFGYFIEDFIEDLGHLSQKYDYIQELGRTRGWKEKYFKILTYEENQILSEVINESKIMDQKEERDVKFLIGLTIGSINDISQKGGNIPTTELEKIKKNIIIFDVDQTKFIYNDLRDKDIITIQGLAGTGKTELLLHKLKDLYINSENSKILFTCHNIILANSLKNRIPDFFDFMKVEEQIKWNERLFVSHGWGSRSDIYSGAYRYICDFYDIPFFTYSEISNFGILCEKTIKSIKEIKENDDFEECYDYALIDESQDFPQSFVDLINLVTKKNVYVAGDIFQNVFATPLPAEIKPDFLLNKCYRTDPRTLMFSHGFCLGLFDKEPITWLRDQEWEACGYDFEREEPNDFKLSRKPLNRFDSINIDESIIICAENEANYAYKVMDIIEKIRSDYPDVTANDIGIVFIEHNNKILKIVDKIEILVSEKFKWKVSKGYEVKKRVKDTLFISNRNNSKGLEFPFIICMSIDAQNRTYSIRNSIYMILTRSFIKSYFIMDNNLFVDEYIDAANRINTNGYMQIKEPEEDVKESLYRNRIDSSNTYDSLEQTIENILIELNVPKNKWGKMFSIIKELQITTLDSKAIRKIISVNMEFL